MDATVLQRTDPWIVFVLLIVFLSASTEIGFAIGRRLRLRAGEEPSPQVTTIQAGVLGLLGLLLGFTFSMAMTRYDVRWRLVVDESNSIGTTFLRSQMLPEPHKTEVANLLRRYVEVRAEFYGSGSDPGMFSKARDETEQLQNKLWAHAVAAGKIDPRAVTTGLFIQSLNDTIDNYASRIAALENQVPLSIFYLLYFAAVLSMALTGYGCGVAGRRSLISTAAATLLIASVIFMISDLDRPQRGFIQTSQQSMLRLHKSLGRESR